MPGSGKPKQPFRVSRGSPAQQPLLSFSLRHTFYTILNCLRSLRHVNQAEIRFGSVVSNLGRSMFRVEPGAGM